jgi:hypothetical protein
MEHLCHLRSAYHHGTHLVPHILLEKCSLENALTLQLALVELEHFGADLLNSLEVQHDQWLK